MYHDNDIDDSNLPKEEMLNRLLKIQEKRIELDLKDLDVSKVELENHKQLSEKSMLLNAEDRNQERLFFGKESTKFYVFSFFTVLTIAVFIVALVALGEKELAKELVTIFGSAALGALGGYGMAKRNEADTSNDN